MDRDFFSILHELFIMRNVTRNALGDEGEGFCYVFYAFLFDK